MFKTIIVILSLITFLKVNAQELERCEPTSTGLIKSRFQYYQPQDTTNYYLVISPINNCNCYVNVTKVLYNATTVPTLNNNDLSNINWGIIKINTKIW